MPNDQQKTSKTQHKEDEKAPRMNTTHYFPTYTRRKRNAHVNILDFAPCSAVSLQCEKGTGLPNQATKHSSTPAGVNLGSTPHLRQTPTNIHRGAEQIILWLYLILWF